MFCKHCGKEVNDKAVVCVSCGCATDNYEKAADKPTSYPIWYIGSVFIPLLGMVKGIILVCKDKVGQGIAMLIWSIFWALVWLAAMGA